MSAASLTSRAALLAAGCLLAAGAQAQVYKCVDAGGKTVYSQAPCPSGDKSKTLSTQTPPAAAPSGGKSANDAEMEFRKRQLARDEADKKAAQAASEDKQKQENCNRARASVAQLQAGGRLSRYNANGEREFLGDAELQQEKTRSQALVDQWCK